MASVRVREADGRVTGAARWDLLVATPGERVLTGLPMPDGDLAALRWDGADGLRAATAEELAAAATAAADTAAQRAFDDMKALKALALVVADLTSQTPAQLRARFLAHYRAL